MAYENLVNEVRVAAATRKSGALFAELNRRKGFRLHLGCGKDVRSGWVNVDVRVKGAALTGLPADAEFINHDLRRGLPVAEGICDYIYSSHFFEHLSFDEGVGLMKDCHRALRPGGVFRAALPNLKAIFAAYLAGDDEFLSLLNLPGVRKEFDKGIEAPVDFVNYGVYQWGQHRHIYDEEKLSLVLRKIGFSQAGPAAYLDGVDAASELRRRYSFYVEAVK